jgi:hypothetical protein
MEFRQGIIYTFTVNINWQPGFFQGVPATLFSTHLLSVQYVGLGGDPKVSASSYCENPPPVCNPGRDTVVLDASSTGHIVQVTHRQGREASYKGRIVQGTHRPRDASYKGRIVQGTHGPSNALQIWV